MTFRNSFQSLPHNASCASPPDAAFAASRHFTDEEHAAHVVEWVDR
jgi:hypothetical protein